jgi:hypothetical protein
VRVRIEIDIDHAQVELTRYNPEMVTLSDDPATVARQLLDAAWMDGCAWLARRTDSTEEPT